MDITLDLTMIDRLSTVIDVVKSFMFKSNLNEVPFYSLSEVKNIIFVPILLIFCNDFS